MSNITIHIDDQFMHKLVEDKLEKYYKIIKDNMLVDIKIW